MNPDMRNCGEVRTRMLKMLKCYSKNMSLMLLRQIGVADAKLAKLHREGAMEFKPSESCCQSNYRYLHQRLLSIQGSIQALFSATVFSQRLGLFNIC